MIMYCFHNNSPVHFTIIKDLQMIDLKFAFRSMIDRSGFDRSDRSFSRIVWPLMPRLKNHLPSGARNQKSLCALGQDLHAPGMRAHLNVDPWIPILNLWRSSARLRFIMAIPIPVRRFLSELSPAVELLYLGLAPNRWQAIIWPKDDLVHCIYLPQHNSCWLRVGDLKKINNA